MSLNDLIQTTRPTVNEIVSRFRDELYFVDNSFQRRLVWTERQKVRLIETVLMGYPMPELYLWAQPNDPESGIQHHSIVDGQQRITALTQFASNEWSLQRQHLSPENQAEPFADSLWKELGADAKGRIWNYVVNVRNIPHTVSKEAIRAIFKRLNETDRSLNPQELRNAEFNGEFIKASEQIAENPRWREWGVFADSQIRRMADIQLASSMLIFLRRGVVSDTPTTINEIYDLYNDVYETKEADVAAVSSFLDRADQHYFVDPGTRAFFTKPINLYTLFCVDYIATDRGFGGAEIAAGVNRFAVDYEAGGDDARLENYREGASSRTTSKASRDRRVDSLLQYLGMVE